MDVYCLMSRGWELDHLLCNLSRHGYAPHACSTYGFSSPPGRFLMLIDLRVTTSRGIAVIRDVRRRLGYGPGILTLHSATRNGVVAALDAGADSFISGPPTPELILSGVNSLTRLVNAAPQLVSCRHQAGTPFSLS